MQCIWKYIETMVKEEDNQEDDECEDAKLDARTDLRNISIDTSLSMRQENYYSSRHLGLSAEARFLDALRLPLLKKLMCGN